MHKKALGLIIMVYRLICITKKREKKKKKIIIYFLCLFFFSVMKLDKLMRDETKIFNEFCRLSTRFLFKKG